MERPNVLLILTDQMRGDCLGVEGAHPVLTPNLDGLAREGVRFSRAYATCPVCIPARRSLLAGQVPSTHGLLGYQDGLEWNPAATLPSALRDAGYQTFHVGRSIHQYPVRKRFGFDEMITLEDHHAWMWRKLPFDVEHRADDIYHGPHLATGIMHNDWTARAWPYDEDLHPTNWTVTQARRFLRRRDPSCPFFLLMSFMAPHPPLEPPPFYFERYLRMDLPEPAVAPWAPAPPAVPAPAGREIRLEGELLRSALAGYYGSINHIDDQIRRVLYWGHAIDGLDLDNTVVIFTSDHGEMLGDHHGWQKSKPYEGAARIPLILKAPERFGLQAGSLVDQPVGLEDVMPTVLELAGVPVPESVDGRSVVPLAQGKQAGWQREWLHLEHGAMPSFRVDSFHALTDGREKYVWFGSDGREQLFELESDPRELRDLAPEPDMSERVAVWRERLVEHLRDRPEGFVSDGRLQTEREHGIVMEHASGSAA